MTAPQTVAEATTAILTETDRALMRAAVGAYPSTGAMEQAMTAATGMPVSRCWQRLDEVLETREALQYAPVTVYFLRRFRARRAHRSSSAVPEATNS